MSSSSTCNTSFVIYVCSFLCVGRKITGFLMNRILCHVPWILSHLQYAYITFIFSYAHLFLLFAPLSLISIPRVLFCDGEFLFYSTIVLLLWRKQSSPYSSFYRFNYLFHPVFISVSLCCLGLKPNLHVPVCFIIIYLFAKFGHHLHFLTLIC